RDNPQTYEELPLRPTYTAARDNTYVAPPVYHNPYAKPPVIIGTDAKPENELVKKLMGQFAAIIRHAQVGLSLKSIKTSGGKDIELAGMLNFILNHRTFNVRNTLGNSRRTLPYL